jgi:hypothetical protein
MLDVLGHGLECVSAAPGQHDVGADLGECHRRAGADA